MKKTLSIFTLIIFATLSVKAEDINWLASYDEALAAAKSENKNIYVLITAPSWCIWCTRLEENVLSKDEFKRYINDNYIPLMLLDKVDGKRNPELDNFDFSGYPSVFLYDGQGRYIDNIYTQDPVQMLASVAKYKEARGKFRPKLADLILPQKYTFTADGGGEYVNNGNDTWTFNSGGDTVLYKVRSFDYRYLYLSHPSGEHIIALPMKGTDRHIANLVDEKWQWSDLSDVIRIGGDPYFD